MESKAIFTILDSNSGICNEMNNLMGCWHISCCCPQHKDIHLKTTGTFWDVYYLMYTDFLEVIWVDMSLVKFKNNLFLFLKLWYYDFEKTLIEFRAVLKHNWSQLLSRWVDKWGHCYQFNPHMGQLVSHWEELCSKVTDCTINPSQ